MIESRVIYSVNGKDFVSYSEAFSYDLLCREISDIMSPLYSSEVLSKDFYIACFRLFIEKCKLLFPAESIFFDELLCDNKALRNHMCYDILWRYSVDYPIMFVTYEYFITHNNIVHV
jgi:hypothetical protein